MSETKDQSGSHWADNMAAELIAAHPNKDQIVCASGISPSGVVHIGNFREVITVDFVVRALRKLGKKTRFIYSWDECDALRKVPKNLPDQDKIEPELRKPLAAVPDPFGTEASYAAHFEKLFESEIAKLGIDPEYIYQHECYMRGDYQEGTAKALEKKDEIREILNQFRTSPLPDDWTPISIFCKQCKKDATKFQKFEAPATFHYHCKICKEDLVLNPDEGGAKLPWRVDWPMRWAKEQVDFEPGGKDHSSQGGSYETGTHIVRKIYGQEPPRYIQYDFVMVKGVGGKLSSSSGNLISLSQALEVYEPAIVRWLFASRKPNLDFSIAFDLDVLKAYDDFDRTERIALGTEDAEPKKKGYEERIYELSVVSVDELGEFKKNPPPQFPFRHLCNLLQIHQGDIEKTKAMYSDQIKNDIDDRRFTERATCAWRWIQDYAPEAFRFSVRAEDNPPEKAQYPDALREVTSILGKYSDADELGTEIFSIMKKNGLKPKPFFADIYQVLIGKPNGPKLAPFLFAIGQDRAKTLLEKAL